MVDQFQPTEHPYVTDDGRKLILVVSLHKGYRAYWIETPEGKVVFKPRFYDADAIRLILEEKGAER